MARMTKRHTAEPPINSPFTEFDHFRGLHPGDLFEVRTEQGTFKFRQHVINSKKHAEWIEAFDGTGFRAFDPQDIVTNDDTADGEVATPTPRTQKPKPVTFTVHNPEYGPPGAKSYRMGCRCPEDKAWKAEINARYRKTGSTKEAA